MTPVIQRIRLSSMIKPGQHDYTLYYEVKIFNYAAEANTGSFQTDADNFALVVELNDEGGGHTISPITHSAESLTHSSYRTAIPKDDSILLSGAGTHVVCFNSV